MSYSQSFQLKHFLPHIFMDSEKYFKVDATCNIIINLSGVENVLATSAPGAYLTAMTPISCVSYDIVFNLKRVTNQVEEAASQISNINSYYLQQIQALSSGVSFNQSFGQA